MTPPPAKTITLTLTIEEARDLSAALSAARVSLSVIGSVGPALAGAVKGPQDRWLALRERLHALMSLVR